MCVQELSAAAQATLETAIGKIPETWKEIWAQKLGGRSRFTQLMHIVASSDQFNEEPTVRRIGARTAHVLVGATTTSPGFTTIRTGTGDPKCAITVGTTSVPFSLLLSKPRVITRHAEGEAEARAMCCVGSYS